LTSQNLPDIKNDRSLSVLYFFPKQLSPHRSILLPGVKRTPRTLSSEDLENAKNGGRGRGRGGWDNGRGRRGDRGGNGPDRGSPYPPRSTNHGPSSYHNDRGYGGRGGNSYQHPVYSSPLRPPYQSQSQAYGGYGGGGGGRPPQNHGGQTQYGPPHRGIAPPRGGASNYNLYGSSYGGYGGGGMSGAYEGSPGYGGYGQVPVNHGYGGYNGGMRGSGPHNSTSRARGRGW